jgi:uncharacterized membrane protein
MLTILEKLLEPKSNAIEATKLLVDNLKVKIAKTTLTKELEEHPDYPSLLSIGDVLNNYGIENLAIKLDPEKLGEIPVPFIAPIKGEKNDVNFFTVIREIKQESLTYFDPEKREWGNISKEDFLKTFSGTVLLVEADEHAGEKEYNKKIKEEKRTAISQRLIVFCIPAIVILAGIAAFLRVGASALLPFIFSIVTLLGAVMGVLLLWYELDQYNPVLLQICSAGKKINCGAVLNSKAAKIAGISWSSIGFSYFMGELLLLLFAGVTNAQTLFIVSWLNVSALPYILFSIYYQWKIAKHWCVMCLYVQGLLLFQFAIALIGGWHSLFSFDIISIELVLMTATAFGVPFMATMLLIPALQKGKENKKNKNELQRLKHSAEIFEALLAKQKTILEGTHKMGITLGKPDAKYKLVKVCNPYCGPCAKAHIPMEDLLENNSDVQIQIIFTATNKEGDRKTLPVKHLMAIAEKGNERQIKQALDDWYLPEKKDYAVFAAKHPMNGELQHQEAKIEAMNDWCNKSNIVSTPTFFLNGREVPSVYSVNDLKYLLTI